MKLKHVAQELGRIVLLSGSSLIYLYVCVDVQPGHLSGGKHNYKRDIWKASLLNATWYGAASSPSGWRRLHTGYTEMDAHL